MGCSWFNTETNKKKTSINNKNMHLKYFDKKSPVMRPNLQPKIYKSLRRISTMYVIPVNFWELLAGRSPPYQLF
jgi:hypothetical protein